LFWCIKFAYNFFMELKVQDYLLNYLSKPQKDLIDQGKFMISEVIEEGQYHFNDYSFLVFPYAKAYEGFLKQLFLDINYISEIDYYSDHFRLGKVLSPNLIRKLGKHSVYKKIVDNCGEDLAQEIWNGWKLGRNQVFHYFPHNVKSLEFNEAVNIVKQILNTMEDAVYKLKFQNIKNKIKNLSNNAIIA